MIDDAEKGKTKTEKKKKSISSTISWKRKYERTTIPNRKSRDPTPVHHNRSSRTTNDDSAYHETSNQTKKKQSFIRHLASGEWVGKLRDQVIVFHPPITPL
jgi:hypothetical protein